MGTSSKTIITTTNLKKADIISVSTETNEAMNFITHYLL